MEFIPIILIAALFWLLLIRPQSKRQRQMREMQATLGPGDRVMLQSGIYATVFGIDEEQGRLQLELAPGVVVEAARAAIASVDTPAALPADPDDASADDGWSDGSDSSWDSGSEGGTDPGTSRP